MKDHLPILSTVAAASGWTALGVNAWFLQWNATLQGLVYILAIVSSMVALIGYLSNFLHRKKLKEATAKTIDEATL